MLILSNIVRFFQYPEEGLQGFIHLVRSNAALQGSADVLPPFAHIISYHLVSIERVVVMFDDIS